jgi:probable HAF family extracellular repeat protein
VITDLGASGEAFALNDAGDVVGSTITGSARAFAWKAGKLTFLRGGSVATAVNGRGEIVGYGYAGVHGEPAYLWRNRSAVPLEALGSSCPSSRPNAINDRGWVVGWSGDQDDCSDRMSLAWSAALWRSGTLDPLENAGEAVAINEHAQIAINVEGHPPILWERGAQTEIGFLHGYNEYAAATAINNRGQVVGASSGQHRGGYETHAFLWEKGEGLRDLGTLGGKQSMIGSIYRGIGEAAFGTYFPTAINDLGQIVGASTLRNGHLHGFLWQDGTMTDLGTLGNDQASAAIAINGSGQIVGVSTTAATNPQFNDDPKRAEHAFVWQAGKLTRLPTLGGSQSFASAINEGGEIAGSSTTKTGQRHAVIWTLTGNS